ncbi:MAG: sulfotransferase [Anaerolineales bacterium]|nr:sulfotransferase [Anaerolineales bacterium]
MSDRIKVLYITGSGRSGSTILGNLLGQVNGFVHVGEMQQIWSRGFRRNFECACGQSFQDCPVWVEIVEEAFGDSKNVDARALQQASHFIQSRHFLKSRTVSGRETLATRGKSYLDALKQLYQAVQRVHGADFIVDSSKFHTYGYALGLIPELEVYYLHLVRDARGVAHSWAKKMKHPGAGQREMHRFSASQSTYLWLTRNFFSRWFLSQPASHYRLLRYEDFVQDPHETMADLLRWLNRPVNLDFFVDHNHVRLGLHHTFSGNPVRQHSNEVIQIRADELWRQQMTAVDRLKVTLLSFPYLKKYGYS